MRRLVAAVALATVAVAGAGRIAGAGSLSTRAPPHGALAGMTGTSSGSGEPVTGTGFTWPPVARTLSTRWLVVEAVPLADGSIGVRADSEVVWITPRPASERIPNSARRLVVTTRQFGRIIQGPLRVTSPTAVRRIVAMLNALSGGAMPARRLRQALGVRIDTGAPSPVPYSAGLATHACAVYGLRHSPDPRDR
jgi:hypothetical protein